MNSGAPTRASSAFTVWLIADGDTPRSAAAAEKLRRSATRRKASIPSSAPWGIVKSCFRALADYSGLSIGAIAAKKVAQRNERTLSHDLSALLLPPFPIRLRDRRGFGARLPRPDRKSVVSGKSVPVRVDLCGPRIFNKNKIIHLT